MGTKQHLDQKRFCAVEVKEVAYVPKMWCEVGKIYNL